MSLPLTGWRKGYTILSDGALETLRAYWKPTHVFESGTELRYIEELLGHKGGSKTTEIYTDVSRKDLARIRSPLDRLKG